MYSMASSLWYDVETDQSEKFTQTPQAPMQQCFCPKMKPNQVSGGGLSSFWRGGEDFQLSDRTIHDAKSR